ncbi:MAG: SDR family NAD(P)-dependent oxidoreductase [Proteobacteria bacterium]|jgi:NADP-dependent 3-hydroxy acid dehydrogenase YdfG|nr:SDR family NAD(P)-dependent oxidoreductase [Pseudomonadota bacterium]
MSAPNPLKDKVAVVTGASSGIGRAVSFALAKEGMKLAMVARRLDALVEMEHEVEARGGSALALAVDLRDESQIQFAFSAIKRELGGVDVLVNAAGLGHKAPLVSGSTEHFREMLEVNVLALAVVTREAVRDMRERKVAGQIVHVSSLSAQRVQAGAGMYAATKHAVRALTEGLRQELRALDLPIRVASVSPGDTETEFVARMLRSKQAAADARPAYRQLDADDVAEAVLYILRTPPHVAVHDVLLRPIGQPD